MVSCAVLEHGVELGFGDREPVWCPASDRWAWYSPGVMESDVPPVMVMRLGISELAAWGGTDNEVNLSSKRLCCQSTTPMRGCVTSDTANRHVKSRRKQKVRLRDGCS